MIRDNYSAGALLLALGVLLVPADAQRLPQLASKVPPSNTPVATDTRPALEPKAIDLLKAASSRLAAARHDRRRAGGGLQVRRDLFSLQRRDRSRPV